MTKFNLLSGNGIELSKKIQHCSKRTWTLQFPKNAPINEITDMIWCRGTIRNIHHLSNKCISITFKKAIILRLHDIVRTYSEEDILPFFKVVSIDAMGTVILKKVKDTHESEVQH